MGRYCLATIFMEYIGLDLFLILLLFLCCTIVYFILPISVVGTCSACCGSYVALSAIITEKSGLIGSNCFTKFSVLI